MSSGASVQIRSATALIIREASAELRKNEVDLDRRISGRITRLESKDNPADLLRAVSSREVVVRWESDDLGDLNVRVRLSPQEYLNAVRAHENGRTVSVSGKLEKISRG